MKSVDKFEEFFSTAMHAARLAGEQLVSRRNEFEVTGSLGKDLKSEADLAAEKVIFSRLDSTGIPVLSEESRSETKWRDGMVWIVDPLDGTLNYVRGLDLYCVSIALWRDGNPLLGVIYQPASGNTFSGIVGVGATFNGASIRPSSLTHIERAVICTGFPSGRDYATDSLFDFLKLVRSFKKVRLLGSAALSLAYVAAGYVDAYCEEDIWLWDVAAGLALVKAVGGDIGDVSWGSDLKGYVMATNGNLLDAEVPVQGESSK